MSEVIGGDGSVLRRLADEIDRDGPIGFDRFMEIALYDPEDGYFATGGVRSEAAGDFLTSPEVSPLFGETLARFVDAEFRRIERPFAVAEIGGGSGSLLRPLLDALEAAPDRVVVVERSAAARAALDERVPEADPADEIPAMRGVVIANEVLDNLAAAVVIRRGEAWRERLVGFDGSALVPVEADPRPEVAAWADAHAGPVPDGGVVEVQIRATEWIGETLGAMEAGSLVVFDYGDLAEHLEHRRAEGTVRTYRAHHLGPDPLVEPGKTDITMDVNFSAVIAAAEAAGAGVEFVRQDDFLRQWGLQQVITGLRMAERTAARDGKVMEQLQHRSDATGAETLLHPRGLGDFRVVVCRPPDAGPR